MSFLSRFFRQGESAKAAEVEIEIVGRGEGVIYRNHGKVAEFERTFIGGVRIYTDSIRHWADGSEISKAEKEELLSDVLKYSSGWFRRAIVVINIDDKWASLWKEICDQHSELVADIEYD